ncbi:polcalcin Syr v 3 [Populus alba x Populus x berolinensis]|uniref:Polcalcin Syr v 3 n=1 Tax=Populus alba x Populus x berolinensis TaxID=444605 RepID=A0AAD6PUQ0_9ROSI|nr:polcalcin Syr v 3 [Populus alba x Populus x berolinensis]
MADEQAELNRIFKRFDLNGDGKISAAELGDCLKTLGSVTAEEVKRMMAEIDTDGDGSISYQEFLDFAKANSGLMKDVAKRKLNSLAIYCSMIFKFGHVQRFSEKPYASMQVMASRELRIHISR